MIHRQIKGDGGCSMKNSKIVIGILVALGIAAVLASVVRYLIKRAEA